MSHSTKLPGHGEKLSRKQEDAICALLTAPTIVQAAKKAGVSSSTLLRWLQNPAFKAQYRHYKSTVLESATARLRGLCIEAVEVLAVVMNDPRARDSARVAAAGRVLECAYRAEEIENLEVRLEELEKLSSAGSER